MSFWRDSDMCIRATEKWYHSCALCRNHVMRSQCVTILLSQRRMEARLVLIVMGVVGAGKTTVGTLLAQKLGWKFADADDFHPRENIEKISHGIPLTDSD